MKEEEQPEDEEQAPALAHSDALRLHRVPPREQVGAVTGERYEYQYHQAAADALLVLEGSVGYVYCEWHDDYVAESTDHLRYCFYQVKTRGQNRAPWKLTDFFGHRRKKPPEGEQTDSIFTRMLEHDSNFGDKCEAFVFVTDAGIDASFQALIDGVAGAASFESLPVEHAKVISSITKGMRVAEGLTPETVYQFLRRFRVQRAIGTVEDLRGCRVLMSNRIRDLSEVDLRNSEADKIGAELVDLVRTRSHVVLKPLPSDIEELRRLKALGVDDVLRLLSLSPEGYRALMASGSRDAVVQLSRLARICHESKIQPELIPEFCHLKSLWDAWWIEQRHVVNRLDYIALRKEAGDQLKLHAEGLRDLPALRDAARELAGRFSGVLTSTESLTDEVVFGLMLSIVVEAYR